MNMGDFHIHHGPNDACNCKSSIAAQSLDEMEFERGIWTAAIYNDLKRLELFLNKGQQNATDNNGYTALHYASRNGHLEACQMLLSAGANVNAITNSGGVTALMRAAMMGHEKIVQLLLRYSADLYICDHDGNTALHKATEWGHSKVIQLLLDGDHDGRLIHIRNKKGLAANDLPQIQSIK